MPAAALAGKQVARRRPQVTVKASYSQMAAAQRYLQARQGE
jgi:hypothetical protein